MYSYNFLDKQKILILNVSIHLLTRVYEEAYSGQLRISRLKTTTAKPFVEM